MKNWPFFSLVLLLTSCGYRWAPDFVEGGARPTISVPFIAGDLDGTLTSEIIAALASSGFGVIQSKGEYVLQVNIVSEGAEKIGFRIDPQKVDGKVRKNLLASEGRRAMTIEAVLCSEGKSLLGPYRITADVDYDYVDGDSIKDLTFVSPSGVIETVLPFSLGQLEPNESATIASTRPLYKKLKQKIVDAISSS